MNLRNV